MTIAIHTEGLYKTYGSLNAVCGLSITVKQGEVFGLLGPNGAGKSTVVDILRGATLPSGGQVHVFGDVPGAKCLRRCTGFLPAEMPRSRLSTVANFLATAARRSGIPRTELSDAVKEALRTVGLVDNATDRLVSLSSSMEQRLRVAAALVHRPDLVVLDEPASLLDLAGQQTIREIILGLQSRGTAVLLTANHVGEVEMCSNSIAIMKNGKAGFVGNPAEIFASATVIDVEVEKLNDAALSAIRTLAAKMKFQSVPIQQFSVWLKSDQDIPELASAIVTNGVRLGQLTPRRETVDERYRQVVESL